MRRIFWIVLGATVGVLIVRKFSRTAEAYSPEGIGRSVASAADAMRDLADAVREGMAQREQELRVALGVDTGTMDEQTARDLLDNPSAPRGDR